MGWTPVDAVDDLGAASGAKGHRFESCIAPLKAAGVAEEISVGSGGFSPSRSPRSTSAANARIAGGRQRQQVLLMLGGEELELADLRVEEVGRELRAISAQLAEESFLRQAAKPYCPRSVALMLTDRR